MIMGGHWMNVVINKIDLLLFVSGVEYGMVMRWRVKMW